MLLTDTDSLTYKIEAENVYEDFYKDKTLFHFSSYPKDSKYYNNEKNFLVGKMEDETCSMPIYVHNKTIMNLKKHQVLIATFLTMN